MLKYLGVKLIQAEPEWRTFPVEQEVKAIDPGKTSTEHVKHLVDKEGYKVVYPDGYVSWSPKEVFEKAYRRINSMTFGLAIEASKLGYPVARKGWNGKGMFVVYQKGYPQGIPCNKQTAIAWGMNEGDLFKCEPYLQIRMTNGSHAMWVPSINDVLAEDWYIVI